MKNKTPTILSQMAYKMSSRGEKMQDYIGLIEDCISKIDEVVGFVEEKIIKKK